MRKKIIVLLSLFSFSFAFDTEINFKIDNDQLVYKQKIIENELFNKQFNNIAGFKNYIFYNELLSSDLFLNFTTEHDSEIEDLGTGRITDEGKIELTEETEITYELPGSAAITSIAQQITAKTFPGYSDAISSTTAVENYRNTIQLKLIEYVKNNNLADYGDIDIPSSDSSLADISNFFIDTKDVVLYSVGIETTLLGLGYSLSDIYPYDSLVPIIDSTVKEVLNGEFLDQTKKTIVYNGYDHYESAGHIFRVNKKELKKHQFVLSKSSRGTHELFVIEDGEDNLLNFDNFVSKLKNSEDRTIYKEGEDMYSKFFLPDNFNYNNITDVLKYLYAWTIKLDLMKSSLIPTTNSGSFYINLISNGNEILPQITSYKSNKYALEFFNVSNGFLSFNNLDFKSYTEKLLVDKISINTSTKVEETTTLKQFIRPEDNFITYLNFENGEQKRLKIVDFYVLKVLINLFDSKL